MMRRDSTMTPRSPTRPDRQAASAPCDAATDRPTLAMTGALSAIAALLTLALPGGVASEVLDSRAAGFEMPRGAAAVEAPVVVGAGAPGSPVAPPALQDTSPEAIADSARKAIHLAFIAGDLKGLAAARQLLERALVAFPADPMLLHYLGYAHYRTAATLSEQQPDVSQAHLDSARTRLEAARDLHDLPETWAVLSSVYGMSISNPLDAMTLGPKADAAMERALELDPENPRVWLLHGISALYAPPLFGGGTEKALDRFTKSRRLFESDAPSPPRPAWGRAEIHVWFGIAHMQMDDRAAAEREFRRALEIEPDFAWVKYALLPQLEESASN